jgi:predicted ATPase
LELLAQSNPVLMVFEDVHWLDPTTLEVLGRTVDRLRTLRALLIITYRAEFEPPWLERPYVTALNLNRLGDRDIAALIDQITRNKPLPESVRRDIVERTDGIPLFVEEMTRAVLEAASEGDAGKTIAAVPPTALAVPASLHASLMARLDRLGPAKEIAQIGAVIGREFSHPVLAAVTPKDEKALQSALDALTEAGLLFRQGVPPNASYLFKHALVQDVAYGTLLREPRRALHARIAETLESKFAEIADNQPELIARHCTEAGLIEKAAGFWGKAGQRSLERSALVEAAEQLKRALDQISTLPITTTLRREQIKLQIGLITALMNVKGYAAPETKAAEERARLLLEEAEALGEPPDDPLLLFSVLHGVWLANYVAFNGIVMRELAVQLLGLAEKQGATTPLMIGHRVMGNSLLHGGNTAECRAHFDQAIALYNPEQHRSLATRFGQDMKVIVLSWRALAQWLLGYPEAALADANQAINEARGIGQAASVMYALGIASFVFVTRGDYKIANTRSDEVIALADEKGASFWKTQGMRLRGQCLALTGKSADAVEVLTSAVNAYRSAGSTALVPLDMLYLAQAHADLGQFADAWSCIGEAMKAEEAAKDRLWEADILRVAGEIALDSPEPDPVKAQAYFERALAVARQQQAKSWELRAAMSLARLWRDQGKVQQARELLAPVYGWFTEGFDTRDLKEAKALLEELAA